MPFPQEFEQSEGHELEWQFAAHHLEPVERWILQRAGDFGLIVHETALEEFNDTYFDTEDWGFFRAGYKLRLRQRGSQTEATLKSLSSNESGDATYRRELTEEVPDNQASALQQARGQVGEWVRGLAKQRELRRLFVSHTWRQTFVVRHDGATVGQIALEQTTLPLNELARGVNWNRVRISLLETAASLLEEFLKALRAACHLRPVGSSKFEVGLQLNQYDPRPFNDLEGTPIEQGMSAEAMAVAVMGRQFSHVWRKEAVARVNSDLESLDELCEAVERFRESLALLGDYLPDALRSLRPELDWATEPLNSLCRLERYRQCLEAHGEAAEAKGGGALAELLAKWTREKKQARRRFLKRMDSKRFERFRETLTRLVREGPTNHNGAAWRSAFDVASEQIGSNYKGVLQVGSMLSMTSTKEEYDSLIAAVRRLVLTLQWSAGWYDGAEQSLVERAQELMGTCQRYLRLRDCWEAFRYEATSAETVEAAWPSETIFILGSAARPVADEMNELRRTLPQSIDRIRGKPWKRLKRALARDASEVRSENR